MDSSAQRQLNFEKCMEFILSNPSVLVLPRARDSAEFGTLKVDCFSHCLTSRFILAGKETIPDDDDPTYASIRSMNRMIPDEDVAPSTSYEMAPPVPHRDSNQSSPSKSTGFVVSSHILRSQSSTL